MTPETLPAPNRFTLELIKGALNGARSEMEALIARSAMSPFIREKKDYFTAFLNSDGELVVSTSLTLAGNLVDAILEEYPARTMRPGDLYWYNDAYGTGGAVSHLPDMVFVMPVFHEGRLFAFAEAWGHLWDIGGSVPGSISPHAVSVFQEGIMIPPVRVVREGVENREVVRIFMRNSRFPDMLRGDLQAIMAACRLGARRLTETVERHGVEVVEAAFEAMLAESEGALRREIADRIPDGEYAFRDRIDSDAVTERSYFVDLVLRKGNGAVEMDFSASDRQADGPINFLMDDSVPKFMLGLWMCMDRPGIGMNGGFERAVESVVKKPGSLVAPRFPAPLGLRSHTMIRVTSALFGTLAQATGGQASAAPSVYVLYYLRGRNADGTEPLCIEGLSVGFGARTFADGIDAVYYVAQENYPIEFAEMEFGVEIEAFGIHRDSGGAGRWRGGCGIVRDVRVLSDEARFGIRLDNCRQPAFGVHGGLAGSPGRVVVNPDGPEARDIPTMGDGIRLRKGDLVRIITPGGGGWGNPADRPAEDVLADILDGFVSEEAAARDYGVVLAGDRVDLEATLARRAAMPRPVKMFHRGRYYDADEDRQEETLPERLRHEETAPAMLCSPQRESGKRRRPAMSKHRGTGVPDQPEAWRWAEADWRPIVEKVRAGRSLKPASWPGGARCAVALSFDSDHETQTLRWAQSSPGKLSQGQYGARAGVPRILKLLERYGVPATFFVPAVVAMLHPDEQRRVIAEGHEIGIHSWIHELNSALPPADERDLQMRAADKLEEICGVRPVGIRTPSWDFSEHTLAITREMGLVYDSSLMADDEPYELLEDNEPTGVVELPVEWIRDDAPYWSMDRFSGLRPYTPPGGVLEVFRREFDGAWEEEGLFLLTMHPHFIGHRSRIQVLDELVQHIRAKPGVWFATHADVARYCKQQAGL